MDDRHLAHSGSVGSVLTMSIVCVALSVGCIGRKLGPPSDSDGSASPDDGGSDVSLDRGATVLPDIPPPCMSPIGTPCKSQSDCCGGLSCIALATGVKICTRSCTPSDDPATPLVVEDDCSYPHDYALCACDAPLGFDKGCPGFGGQCNCQAHYCMPRCEPKLGQQTCPEGIACDPRTVALTWPVAKEGQLQTNNVGSTTVCAALACASNDDCPVRLSEGCDTSSPGALCAGSPPGAYCYTEPGETKGTCALPGVCDLASGLCAPHKLGKASALVGDPCQDDRDCQGNMRCDQQRTDKDGVHARNGYCYVEGCSSLPTRDCPAGSVCNNNYPGGRCYKICKGNSAKDCRGYPADQYGDYECYAETTDVYVGFSKVMTCEPVDHVPCTRFLGEDSCTSYGPDMACRDRVTGVILPDKSPAGFCMDFSTSAGCFPGSGYTECNGDCVDPQSFLTDSQNCGVCGNECTCGNICAGYVYCVAGVCGPCVDCDSSGSCTLVQKDDVNCGACGCACPPFASCDAGKCVCNCPPGQTGCYGTTPGCPASTCVGCANLQNNFYNCGACGNVCGSGQSCVNGKCV